MTEISRPEWIAVGTKVLTYSSNDRDGYSAATAVITRVTPTTFAIDKDEKRFKIEAEPSRREGSTWGWTKYVIPLDSDKARQLIASRKASNLRNKARAACDEYAKRQTTETRLAAIAALQAVTEDLK